MQGRTRSVDHRTLRTRLQDRSTTSTYPGSDMNIGRSVDTLGKGLEVDCSPSERYFPLTKSRSRYSSHLTVPHSAPAAGQPKMDIEVSRNPLTPINKLPPEVFSGIFEYLGSDRGLIVATHVCHQWRPTLTSTPLLWTNLDCRDSEWVATFLERSKTAPLDVRITKPLPSFDIQGFLSSNFWRTKSLCVDLSLQGIRAAILEICTPAPLLRELKFQGCRFRIPSKTLSPEFITLSRHAPLLRFIHLDTCPRLSPPFSLPHLTNFELSTHFGQSASARTLLKLLSSAPRLRRVSIHLAGYIAETEVDRDQVILLEDLEFFELRSRRDPIYALPIMRLPRVKDITVALPLGYFESLADLLPYGFDSLLADTDRMAYNGWCGRGSIQFDLPGVTIRVGDSGPMSPTTVVDHLLSGERLFSYLRVRELTISYRGFLWWRCQPGFRFSEPGDT